MSTPLSTGRPSTTAVVPQPRRPVDPPVDPDVGHRSGNRQTAEDEPLGLFGQHPWLVPATGVAMVLAVFLAMVLLTWAAGGGTPFD
jgi:hypothetical protein